MTMENLINDGSDDNDDVFVFPGDRLRRVGKLHGEGEAKPGVVVVVAEPKSTDSKPVQPLKTVNTTEVHEDH